MCMNCQPLIDAIDRYIRKADDDFEELLEDEGRAEPEESVQAINRIEDGIAEALTNETGRIVRKLKKHKTLAALMIAGVLDEIFADDTCTHEIKGIISQELNELVPKLVKGYIRFVDKEIKINSVSKRTLAWIDSWSAELADMMKLSDKETIANIIKNGFTNGSDISSVTLEIMNSGIRDEYYRARRVAVTEILRAHNVAKQEAAMQNPCITEKMWMHTGSHKNEPRENHVDMNGQRVKVSEAFTLVGRYGDVHHPMFPMDTNLPPEESINCHCIAQDIADEDILAMSLEERQALQQKIIEEMDDEWERELDAKNRAKAGIDEDTKDNAKPYINDIALQ